MIAATPYTLGQAVDQLFLLMGQHRTATNLDWGTAVLFVNRGWKLVMTRLLPVQEWMWINRINVGWGTVMPVDFIRPRKALLSVLGTPPYVEARYVDPREFWTLSDWYKGQSWNSATIQNPVYTIAGIRTVPNVGAIPMTTQRVFYSAPYTLDMTLPLPPGFNPPNLPPGVQFMSGVLEYYSMPPDVLAPGALLPLPMEYHNLAIHYALLYVVLKYNPQAIEAVNVMIDALEAEVREYEQKYKREKRARLGSFAEVIAAAVTGPADQQTVAASAAQPEVSRGK